MTVFCDNYGCMFIDKYGFCDCDKLSIVGGVCEGSYHGGGNATENDAGERLKAENAKLRELARRFGEYVSQDRCEGCVMKHRCDSGDVEECWQMTEIRALASELGMEVPE